MQPDRMAGQLRPSNLKQNVKPGFLDLTKQPIELRTECNASLIQPDNLVAQPSNNFPRPPVFLTLVEQLHHHDRSPPIKHIYHLPSTVGIPDA